MNQIIQAAAITSPSAAKSGRASEVPFSTSGVRVSKSVT